MSERKRILTGVRPTGPLHLGHYSGELDNWVKLQRDYDCYFLIADYQVSNFAGDLPRVRNAVWEVAPDWLAIGLDPEGSSFVIESMVPEHAELMTWLAWFMPVGMLERNPTLKAEMEAIERAGDATTRGKSIPVAFYIYPVMKDRLRSVLYELIEPMRERRANYESSMSRVREALEQGTKRARAIARETIEMVRDALGLNYLGKYGCGGQRFGLPASN